MIPRMIKEVQDKLIFNSTKNGQFWLICAEMGPKCALMDGTETTIEEFDLSNFRFISPKTPKPLKREKKVHQKGK